MRQMVVDLPLHPFHLLCDRGGQFVFARASCTVGFLQQDGQWRFQSVSQIARLRLCASDCQLALFKECIEIVDQRLDF